MKHAQNQQARMTASTRNRWTPFSSKKKSRPTLTLNPGLVYYAPEFKSLILRFHGFVQIVHSRSVKTQAYFTNNSNIIRHIALKTQGKNIPKKQKMNQNIESQRKGKNYSTRQMRSGIREIQRKFCWFRVQVRNS